MMTTPAPADLAKDPIRLRIVMFGPPGAGKTTSARSLGARLSQPVISPCEDDGQTRLFDWLEYEGGRHDGRSIRTQLVTVPGDDPSKRRALLETADAVLFVADTTRAGLAGAKGSFAELRTFASTRPDPPAFVVQANKRDKPDARPLGDVRATLELDPDDAVIETVATDGDGVRQAFVYAVRVALRRLAEGTPPDSVVRQATPDELAAFLTATQEPGPAPDEPAAPPVEPPAVEPVPSMSTASPMPTVPRAPRTLHRVRIDDPDTFRTGTAEVAGVAIAPLVSEARAGREDTSAVDAVVDWASLPPPPRPAGGVVTPSAAKRERRRRFRRDDR